MRDVFSLYPEWVVSSACRAVNTEVFFPEKAIDNGPALKVCKGCPVQLACLRDALEQDYNPDGIWGGTTKRRRTILRRQAERSSVDEVLEQERARTVKAVPTHCVNNHPFDERNTRIYRGRRICKTCRRLRKYGAVAA